MKLAKITGEQAIYYTESGEILAEIITPDALKMLDFYKKIPANDI
jgi:hypothetical protein